ncbi:adenylate cyclase [Methanobrevibacter sp. 87.7]|uniref:class IV adenylate cyclase n=1 Tax=Methanobrevibacter sp. 87.7 TaxID=387957 RepID=UPI000B50065E|nr:class IV adenylate cyclase [Methanobrevibacter sp. 87.7]OWT33065.1 adenylate cyclase [Methanobrevibacter sp. 87.7]
MIEVEAKAKINNFDDVRDKIEKLGAKLVKIEHQEDLYFNSPIVDFADTDEALRIRKTNTDTENNLFITYKGPKIDKKSKTREEIEMEIEDKEKCRKIFKHLGFVEAREVIKDREIFKYKNYELSLDHVKGLGPYMEIEILVEDGTDYNDAQKGLFDLFAKLGITDNFERTSYLELLENKN